MKIAFVLSQGIHYFYYDRVVRLLHAEGHEVRIICPADFSEDGNKSGRALIQLLHDVPGILVEDALLPSRKNSYYIGLIRNLLDYSIFTRPEHPTPYIADTWLGKELSAKMLMRLKRPVIRSLITSKAARKLLRLLESLVLPDARIVAWLRIYQPQVVFASPYVFRGDIEVEYTKAAQSLNIPVIASLLSWDNLTSKGTYQVMPDWLFVWNKNLLEEAVQIHDFEPRRVFVTGAPVYDPWFDLKPSLEREVFYAQLGLELSRPYVLYLCSSKSISDRETELIQMLIAHFLEMEEKYRPYLVVRPHPFKEMGTEGIEHDWVKIFPKGGQRPDTDEARSIYYNSLYHSAAVIGVNTTGFLESAILDKPCLTIITPVTSRGQEMRAHFKHLMDAGYIEVAKSFPELVAKIEKNISGTDIGKEKRAKFVNQFIRPSGMETPASEVMAGAILAVAERKKPEDWMTVHHG